MKFVLVLLFALQALAQRGGGNRGPPPEGGGSRPEGGGSRPEGSLDAGGSTTTSTSSGSTSSSSSSSSTSSGSTYSSSSSCSSFPCAASLLGSVATSLLEGTTTDAAVGAMVTTIPAGSDINGPFEAGFTSTQDNILSTLGCSGDPDGSGPKTGTGYLEAGLDTALANKVLEWDCDITTPSGSGSSYVGLLDGCGGHTNYHYHEGLTCLYEETGTHSTAVGTADEGGKYLYGKWEDYSASELPTLDACGGHFGPTPEDSSGNSYHYHVQDNPPFTIGCFGPNADDSLVTVSQCRALYAGCSGTAVTLTTNDGDVEYEQWCPCYDENGSNHVDSSGFRIRGKKNAMPVPSADEIAHEQAEYGKICTNSAGHLCKPARRLLFGGNDDCKCADRRL